MIEEPYRWVEAIANRREYIESQLVSGSPLLALSCADGILLATPGQQKIFEIYDRIALGAVGHPGDIERLRMAAIEVASTEGFTRAAADVSLRRLAHYSLSPVLKNAFEQIYGAPYLVRLLFAELGRTPSDDLFLRVNYDGAIDSSQSAGPKVNVPFAMIGGDAKAAGPAEDFLRAEHVLTAPLSAALKIAQRALELATPTNSDSESPASSTAPAFLEAALLERGSAHAICYRTVSDAEVKRALGS